jgi:hypothetical protein
VTLSQAMIDYMLDSSYTTETNIGSVNSGVAQARADAAAAQATANSASQSAADVADSALAFSASVNPFYVIGTIFGTGAVTTDAATVSVSGGTGPYTYAWAYVSGYASFTTNSPTSATTTWTGTITLPGQDRSAVYRCTVTDSLAATASITIGVSISEIS